MNYFESPVSAGDGRCSDRSCPCPEPGTLIPRGQGYLYISPEAVKFRSDCLSWKEFLDKMQRLGEKFGGNVQFILPDKSVINAILVCEQGARKRNLDLGVAAADARHWWETGKVPLRTTPLQVVKSGKSAREVDKPKVGSEASLRVEKTEQEQKRYKEALKLISDINQYIDQDGSGAGYDEQINTLVRLSPDSIRCIYDIWKLSAPASERTDRLLVEVLASVAKEKTPEERKLAIDTLQKTLDLPDDNTTRPMRRRGACIQALDELKALPGNNYSQTELSVTDKPFQLEPIDPSEIGPVQSNSPQDKPNLEAEALWQLILYPLQRYEEVVQRFEANYTRWSKTFDHRSLSLVLCAYGSALEELGRYCDALIAHRWACKFYPDSEFKSCKILKTLTAKAVKELNEKRRNFKGKEEICEYCFKIIDEHKQACIFNEKIVCKECDTKLRN